MMEAKTRGHPSIRNAHQARPTYAQIAQELGKAFLGAAGEMYYMPQQVMRGEKQVMGADGRVTDDAIRWGADMAGTMTLGSGAMPAQANTLRAGATVRRAAPDLPAKPVVQGGVRVAPDPATIRAYHGSPHDFDRFSMDKIGTGEGAQAYGHGLYFADSEDVARGYRDALKMKGYDNNPMYAKALDLGMSAKEFDAFESIARQTIHDPDLLTREFFNWSDDWRKVANDPDEVAAVRKFAEDYIKSTPKGSMYEVNIKANPDDFLDWDKPLSEQPAKVREALAAMDPDTYHPSGNDYDPMEPGQMIYQRLAAQKRDYGIDAGKADLTTLGGAQSGATSDLQGFGVPGIKYLDAGSRYNPSVLPNNPIANEARKFLDQAGGDGDAAIKAFNRSNPVERFATTEREEIEKVIKAAAKPISRNYVVFDDSLIEIVRKYGIAGALAAGLLTQEQAKMIKDQGGAMTGAEWEAAYKSGNAT